MNQWLQGLGSLRDPSLDDLRPWEQLQSIKGLRHFLLYSYSSGNFSILTRK